MHDVSSIETFLAQAEPRSGSNRFVIGGFESGITLYKQQARALNLIYSFHTQRHVEPKSIAIIGGGGSGLTAAVAAAALGYKVRLFEQRPILLHLQHGCDTRWLHPHLYDWPAPGAERPYAGLPFLNWHAGSAGEVVEQILNGFERIRRDLPENKLRVHMGARVSPVESRRVIWEDSSGDPVSGEEEFGAVVFAVGFGVERELEGGSTPSYWRNDGVNQPEPGASAGVKTRYLISGTGDGGLTDLLRVRIQSFKQGRILREVVTAADDVLVSRLREITSVWNEQALTDEFWLYNRYRKLADDGLLAPLKERLRPRFRKDTEAVLNGREQTLSRALRLDRASLFNTLLVYILHSEGQFQYKFGELTTNDSRLQIGGREEPADRVVIRHGTNRNAVLGAVGFDEGVEVADHPIRRRLDTSRIIYPPGWWGENAGDVLGGQRVEFVPPATQAIATTFVSTLSDVVQLHERSGRGRFRIVLHRLVRINAEEFFQQVSRYAGTRTKGAVGRVFTVTGGLVGLVCRLGRPVIVRREEDFDRLWDELDLRETHARPIDPSVQSLLACPFFAPLNGTSEPRYVSLVLFMDSDQKDFFTRPVLESVYAACRGFVQNLERMYSNGEVSFASSGYPGFDYTKTFKQDQYAVIKESTSAETENEIFKDYVQDLTFEKVPSFDAYLTS